MSEAGLPLPRATRLTAPSGRAPLGLFLAGSCAVGVALVGLLHLDRLPVSVCFFKIATGCPCPTCGATRAFGRLFACDPMGALAMNPLVTLGASLIALWGVADMTLWPWGRALSLEVSPGVARVLRFAVVAAILANWAYLIAAGR
jgi:Protein of unknown function (DUF2752)